MIFDFFITENGILIYLNLYKFHKQTHVPKKYGL